MQMYEVTVLSEDMHTELQKKLLYAEDEEDALDTVEAELKSQGINYGICQALEM